MRDEAMILKNLGVIIFITKTLHACTRKLAYIIEYGLILSCLYGFRRITIIEQYSSLTFDNIIEYWLCALVILKVYSMPRKYQNSYDTYPQIMLIFDTIKDMPS